MRLGGNGSEGDSNISYLDEYGCIKEQRDNNLQLLIELIIATVELYANIKWRH